jgi:sugar lactone lactonase YvrE
MTPQLSAVPETVLDGLVFPECPRWHNGSLYFSDMHDGIVWKLTGGAAERVVELPSRPAGLGFAPDGSLYVVSMRQRKLFRLGPEGLATVADLTGMISYLANDLVVDAQGRAFIGNFGFDLNQGESPKPTVLLRVDPGGQTTVAAENMLFPNGTVITPDGKTLIIAETFAYQLTAFDIGADGALSNRRVYAPLDGLHPDGICLDAEGAIWVACPFMNKIIRVREGGEIAQEIPLPGRDSFACMLGGDDRRTLYKCTAPHFQPEITIPARAGRIEAVRVEVPGAGLP